MITGTNEKKYVDVVTVDGVDGVDEVDGLDLNEKDSLEDVEMVDGDAQLRIVKEKVDENVQNVDGEVELEIVEETQVFEEREDEEDLNNGLRLDERTILKLQEVIIIKKRNMGCLTVVLRSS